MTKTAAFFFLVLFACVMVATVVACWQLFQYELNSAVISVTAATIASSTVSSYQIICRKDIKDLQEEIKKSFDLGWKPYGGVSIASYEETSTSAFRVINVNILACQAVVNR